MPTIDDFIRAHEAQWDRVRQLTRRRGEHSSAELDELVDGYERVTTHVALARSRYGDPTLAAYLSRLAAEAAAVIYGTRPRRWETVRGFVLWTFPASVWGLRAPVAVATLCFLVPAVVVAAWLAASPAALEVVGPESLRADYVEEEFEAYYTEPASPEFAALVSTNNARVGVTAFALGLLACLPAAAVLLANGVNVGVAAGLFVAAGEPARFFTFLLPHGLLELAGVFIAGGAGLQLGWAWIDPGDRRRSEALAAEAKRSVLVVVGLVGVFAVAGLIEGFVTGAPWPPWLKLGIGVVALAGFGAYIGVLGPRAHRHGVTGALGESRADRGVRRLPRPADAS